MTTAQLRAMQQGREKAARKKRRAAIKRVLDFTKWCTSDADYRQQMIDGHITQKQYYQRRPTMPQIPSDYDFAAAREEGAIQ